MVKLVTTKAEVDEMAREGARRMLVHCLNLEVEDYINRHTSVVDKNGRRLVVKNGCGRPRTVTMGSGSVEVSAPRERQTRRREVLLFDRDHRRLARKTYEGRG